MGKIKNVLYLCSGNTCRSPFAEYFSKWLQNTKYKEELKHVKFDSAGLYHYYEEPQEGTKKYLNAKGIDINDFEAKEIDEKLIYNQDLILGFQKRWHIDKLKRKFKNVKDLDKKLFLLLEFAGFKSNVDILDPFDLEEEEYNKVLQRIEQGVIKTIEKIIELNRSENN